MTDLDSVVFAKALADDTRQKIMKITCCEWRTVSEIVELLDVTQPTVSHHLAILREAGLVHFKEEGKQTYYTLNRELVTVCCNRLVTKFSSALEQPDKCC
jgi:DNA-binding transcriptional ArsR family regulator